MKYIKILLLLLVAHTSFAQHTSKWKELYGGGNWYTQFTAGDTLHFNPGSYTYFSGENMNGTPTNRIIAIFEPGAVFSNGFNLTNCSNWFFNGLDKNGNYNLKIYNAPGVALSFKGRCDNIEIAGADLYNVYSFLWWKTEGNDFVQNKPTDDTSYWHLQMKGLKLHDFRFRKALFDGLYIGTTNQQANRPVVYNGITYYPQSVKISDVQIYNGTIDTTYRTACQISGLIAPGSYVYNVKMYNAGVNWQHDGDGQNQGALFRLGGNSIGGITLENCTFKNSHLYAVHSQGGGVITIKNCVVDSATYVVNTVNPQLVAAVEFDTYYYPTTIKVIGNTIGWSNNAVGVVAYGSSATVTETGNEFCNNTLTGTFQNKTGRTFTTTCSETPPEEPDTTYKVVWKTVTHDTLKRVTIPQKIIQHLDSVLVTQSVRKVPLATKTGKINRYAIVHRSVYQTVLVKDTIPAHDSVFISKFGATHDSAYIEMVITYKNTDWGAFVLQSVAYPNLSARTARAIDLGAKLFRDNMFYGNSYQVPEIVDAGLDVSLTYAFSDNDGTHGFEQDSAKVFHVIDSTLASSTKKPKIIHYYNEPDNTGYWLKNAADFNKGYAAAIRAAHNNGVEISDGGFTLSILFNLFDYYATHGLNTELNWLKNTTGINSISNPEIQAYIGFNDSVFDFIKNSNADYVNLHWKEPGVSDTSGFVTSKLLPVIINYLTTVTGKKVITTETGTRNHSASLLYALLDEWKGVNTRYVIYYAGTGGSGAVDLSEYYKNYLQ